MWKSFFVFVKKAGWPLILALAAYVVLAFVNPFSTQHVLFNLEPYPDGLFYVDAAQNLAKHGAFEVSYRGFVLKPRIEPLYPVVLAVGYVLNASPVMFYGVNSVLGALSILFLFLALRNLTQKNVLVAVGLFVYLVHLHLVWLVSVPMAENLGLAIFLATVWGITLRRLDLRSITAVSFGIGLLVLTKYTFVGPAGVLGLFLWYRIWREFHTKKKWSVLATSTGVFVALAVLFFLYQLSIGYNPFAAFSGSQFGKVSVVSGVTFYSLRFIVPNFIAYLKIFIGFNSPFLWLSYAFTNIGFFAIVLVGNIWLWWSEKKIGNPALFLLLFLAQFPLLLIFYVVDDRYIIFSLPLIAMSVVLLLENLKNAKYVLLAILLLCLAQLFLQRNFLKMLIADNLLHRSTAWQYEAVKQLDKTVPSDGYLITALPPLFVDLYSTANYHLLPLSPKQEFADKHQMIWRSDINYDNLLATYAQLLAEHKKLYVTNAYLSSNHDMEKDWQAIQNNFTLRKVADGCLGTCDTFVVESTVH